MEARNNSGAGKENTAGNKRRQARESETHLQAFELGFRATV